MRARCSAAWLLALAALAGRLAVWAQPAGVTARSDAGWKEEAGESAEEDLDVEKRYTSELASELRAASDDVLLLFTEYTGRAGYELKAFLRNMSALTPDTLAATDRALLRDAPAACVAALRATLRGVEASARRAAALSAEKHHKFLLGHMIVFRMHLNKSEEYVRRGERLVAGCGTPCETTPRVVRWRRLALEEISRVRDDLQHSRRAYHDLLLHARRRLLQLGRRARAQARAAALQLQLPACAPGGRAGDGQARS
ncbi:uncharacterized protein [Battus philenor]|uniref:uncharacterized protein n=1 Tax=Battus philenor TaxID=42288 RepID=UPI0035D00686